MKLEKGRGGYCKNDTAGKGQEHKKNVRLKTWGDKRKSGKRMNKVVERLISPKEDRMRMRKGRERQ